MNPEDFHANEDDEYLTRVVIDTCARTFYMYSNEGGKRKIISVSYTHLTLPTNSSV